MNTDPSLPPHVHRPLLIVVSAPSGAGKTTLCDRLLAEHPSMVYSISCTTRAPRGDEVDGRDYHFLSASEFERRVAAGEFIEHARVHGNWYGTLRQTVLESLSAGKDVLMDIDVQGAALIRAVAQGSAGLLKTGYVDVFIAPPSLEALRLRLTVRNEDTPEVIERRIKNAVVEMARWREYQYMVINDELDEAYVELRAVVRAEHCRTGA
jgi:guanylate kinase